VSGFITNTGENFLLNLICRDSTAPDMFWLALITRNEPTKFTTGAEIDEPDVNEYARIPYQNVSGNWSARSGEMSNILPARSVVVSGNEVWPTIRHWGILDAQFGGNLLWAGSFDNPINLNEGDWVEFAPGAITLRTASYLSRTSLI
jgi:hypothetical protein